MYFFKSKFIFFKKSINNGKYEDKDLSKPFFVDYLTGCFQLYKTHDFVALEGFDDRYFLYMEDVDICRKIDKSGKKKMYYPNEEIIHVLKKESNNTIKIGTRELRYGDLTQKKRYRTSNATEIDISEFDYNPEKQQLRFSEGGLVQRRTK